MVCHPHRSRVALNRYQVTTKVRLYGATIWDEHSDMVAARTSQEAEQIARSRLRRMSYEIGQTTGCQDLGPCK